MHAHCSGRTGDDLLAFLGIDWREVKNAYKPAQSAPEAPAQPAEGPKAPAAIMRLTPLDWAEVKRTGKTPRKWAIEDWLSYDPTLFAGMGGIGKSLLAQQLGMALAMRKGFIGAIERELRVLMWACEDGRPELGNRGIDIAEHLGIDLEALTGKFIVMPRRGLDNTLFAAPYDQPGFTALLGELEEQINDLHINVLFLDNIAQTYAGREADRHQVTKFINGIYGCARHQDFAPVIMGHPAKVAGSEYSGSTAWENAVRMRWYLGDRLPDENQDEGEAPDPKVRVLAKRKTNYSEKDWRRFTFEAGVLVPDTVPPAGSGIIGHLYDQAAERAMLDGLKRLQEMGMHPSEGATTSRYLPRLLLEYKLAEGRSKAELAGAMRRLMVDGKLVKSVVGKYAGNRSPMYGLTAAE